MTFTGFWRGLALTGLLCLVSTHFTAAQERAQPRRATAQTPTLRAQVAEQETAEPGLLTARVQRAQPVRRARLANLQAQQVSLGDGESESLGAIAVASFESQRAFAERISRPALIGRAITTLPEVNDEVLEFDDSFVIRRSTRIVVIDPAEVSRAAPEFGEYLSARGEETMTPDDLDPDSRAALQEFIAEAETLDPADPLRAAAARGEQAVLDAILAGQGELVIEDTLVVPKAPPRAIDGVTARPVIRQGTIDLSHPEPVQSLQLKAIKADPSPALKAIPARPVPETKEAPFSRPIVKAEGRHEFDVEFLMGVTRGHSWQWERKWEFPSGYFRLTLGQGYGLGMRFPVRVTGALQPTDILLVGDKDRAYAIKGNVRVQTVDGNADFYSRAGLDASQLFNGREILFEAEAGFGYKLRAFWKTIRYRPFSGFGINFSQNLRPPLGSNCQSCAFHINLPENLTRTVYNGTFIKGRARMRFAVGGNGRVRFKLEGLVGTRAAWTRQLAWTNSDSVPFEIDLQPRPLRAGSSTSFQRYGFRLSEPVYDLGLTVVPEVQIEIRVGYKKLSRLFKTQWIPLNAYKLKFASIPIPRHQGTRANYTFADGEKRFVKFGAEPEAPARMTTLQAKPARQKKDNN